MKNAGAWLWVLVAALLFAVAAAPLTSQAADGSAPAAKKPKPDAGK